MNAATSPNSVPHDALTLINRALGGNPSLQTPLVGFGDVRVVNALFDLERCFGIEIDVDEVWPHGTVGALLAITVARARSATAAKVVNIGEARARRARAETDKVLIGASQLTAHQWAARHGIDLSGRLPPAFPTYPAMFESPDCPGHSRQVAPSPEPAHDRPVVAAPPPSNDPPSRKSWAEEALEFVGAVALVALVIGGMTVGAIYLRALF